ncbi:MAG: LysR family transcriptional regulator, partial [Planctomycetes bacterium]|nr:LysR family transcriptional regulator [Planctomycetota bacterium]
ISARIAALEQLLDARLMERDAGSVRLTAKGSELLVHAREVLRAAEGLVEASGKANLTEGVLRLGVTELVVNTWLRDFLRRAKQRFPNISIELTVDLSVRIDAELLSRSLDLALQSAPFQWQAGGEVDLGTWPYTWVVAPTLWSVPSGAPVDELPPLPVLTHARGTRAVDELERHLGGRRRSANTLVPSSSMSACLHMAVDGLGVAVLPVAMVRGEVAAGRLVEVGYPWVPEPLSMVARYHADTAAGFVARVAALARRVAGDFRGEDWSENQES